MGESIITINLGADAATGAVSARVADGPPPDLTVGASTGESGSGAAATDAPPPDADVGGADLGSLDVAASAASAPAPDGATANTARDGEARGGDDAPRPLTPDELNAVIAGETDG